MDDCGSPFPHARASRVKLMPRQEVARTCRTFHLKFVERRFSSSIIRSHLGSSLPSSWYCSSSPSSCYCRPRRMFLLELAMKYSWSPQAAGLPQQIAAVSTPATTRRRYRAGAIAAPICDARSRAPQPAGADNPPPPLTVYGDPARPLQGGK